jgi:demethylmenaquinone methyltransferase/2-methoxy-6-polyprenyl-1,4-benzoquinol methylase
MFGRISPWYDLLNHTLSLGLDITWRRRMMPFVRCSTTGRVLDLAAGTLDVSRQISRSHPGCAIIGADLALPMLRRGLPKMEGARFLALCADGLALPVAEASLDCVTIAFGIRNIAPRSAAYREMLRVLAPRGRLCILEFGSGRERIWGGVYNFYLRRLLPGLGRLVSKDREAYGYLARTISEFPSAEELADELRWAGFENVGHRPFSSGIVRLHTADKPGGEP